MHKEVVEILVELREVYDLIREKIVDTSEIEESDEIFLKIYEKYVFANKKEDTLN